MRQQVKGIVTKLANNKKLEILEKKDLELNEKVNLIFEYLRQFEQSKQEETDFKNRKRIGFKTNQSLSL
jgi:hypothetical protein